MSNFIFLFAKTFLAVNHSVIVGVQTLVCAYAKLKVGDSITRKLTARNLNHSVIVGVQTLVCAYAKLKRGDSITRKLTARNFSTLLMKSHTHSIGVCNA
jgi:hypothetical protein